MINKKGGKNSRDEKNEKIRKDKVKAQIKRSEGNLRTFFNELKKVLSKPDEDVILPELATSKVTWAKEAEKEKHFGSYMYTCFLASRSVHGRNIDENAHKKPKRHDVSMNQFQMFIKHFSDQIDDANCNEIFMLLNKKLASLLQSPQKSRDLEDDGDKENDDLIGNGLVKGGNRGRSTLGKSAKNNKNDGNSPSPMKDKKDPGLFGMDQYEFESLRLDLSALDAAYDKFAKEDDSMSGVPNAKLTK